MKVKTITYIANKGDTFKTLFEGRSYSFRKGVPVKNIPIKLAQFLEAKVDEGGNHLFGDKALVEIHIIPERSLTVGDQLRYFQL